MSEKVTSTDRKSETKGEKTSSLIQKSCSSQNIESTVDRILFLQRTMGNQKVGMLISSGTLQAKFMNPKTVNGPTLTMGDGISDTVVQRTPAKEDMPLELKDDSARFEGDKKLEDITIGADKVSKGARGLTVTKLQQTKSLQRY
jgi:hypothetical protein